MTELERALVHLGDRLAFPAAPELAERVLGRLAAEPAPRRGFDRRRVAVLALAVLAVAVGAALAVPQARTAILELLRLRGATVERADTLPAVPTVPSATARALELGEPVPLGDGRPWVKISDVLLPSALGRPDAAYSSEAVPGKLSLVYGPEPPELPRSRHSGVGVLVTQFDGEIDDFEYVSKIAASGTVVERVTVDGRYPGIWLEGGPHFVLFRTPDGSYLEDTARLAGNTLLVERGDRLVRIEGEISRERALEIAASLSPG